MRIQRFYFLFYVIMIIPNFFMMTPIGLSWYSVFTCLHPLVIIVILLWSISLNAQNLERKSGPGGTDGTKEGGKDGGGHGGEGKGTELSDYSSFMDDRSDMSIANNEAAHSNHQYRAVAEAAGKEDFEDKDLG